MPTGEELALDDVENGLIIPEHMLRDIQAQPREDQYYLLERLNAIMERYEEQMLDLRCELNRLLGSQEVMGVSPTRERVSRGVE